MDRRRYLASVLGGLAGGIAGCAGAVERTTNAGSPTRSGESTNASSITGADGYPREVCENEPRPERIPTIIGPAFAPNWDAVSASGLGDPSPVIGIHRNGASRAYPISVLGRYEIVNDSFDIPVLVTYCPICASGLTAVRRVNGQESVFGNTSFTWRAPGAAGRTAIESDRVFGVSYRGPPAQTTPTNDQNLVMFDSATRSFWSQLLAQAICGPLTGETLSLVPSTVTDWGTWRNDHPESTVLLPPPHSTTMTA